MQIKTKSVNLSDISIDGETQQREKINIDIVAEYAESMRCGAKFPAVTLFYDGANNWLADGFHRYHAAREVPSPDILSDIREGTQRDARLYSASANGTHGMRLTNADKRRSVMVLLGDKEWSQWSDNQIAKHCHVTQPYVGKIRKELEPPEVKVKSQHITVISPECTSPDGTKDEKPEVAAPDYDPHDEELENAHDTVRELAAENEALKDRLAVELMPGCEEDKTAAINTIQELRARVVTLEAELDAVKASRDGYMREAAAMKQQLKMQRREIENLKGQNNG